MDDVLYVRALCSIHVGVNGTGIDDELPIGVVRGEDDAAIALGDDCTALRERYVIAGGQQRTNADEVGRHVVMRVHVV